jgi:cysteine desulfurase
VKSVDVTRPPIISFGSTRRPRHRHDELWEQLRLSIAGLRLNGHPTDRLPNTLNVSFPGVSGSKVLTAAPEIASSTGSACHDGAEAASPVLLAMGVAPTEALGAIRLSIGRSTTGQQITHAVRALERAFRGTVAEGEPHAAAFQTGRVGPPAPFRQGER